jgi:hypothetical protein
VDPLLRGKKKKLLLDILFIFSFFLREIINPEVFFSPVVWGVKHETPGDFAVKNCFSPIYDGDFKKKV